MIEHPFGHNISEMEYTNKYMESLDKFFEEAKSNGVWFYATESMDNQTGRFSIISFSTPGLSGYLPFWSSPADALSLGLHIGSPVLQSVPLSFFDDNIMSKASSEIIGAPNPVIRDSKRLNSDGNPTVGLVPPVMLPLNMMHQIYTGKREENFARNMAVWVTLSHNAVHEF